MTLRLPSTAQEALDLHHRAQTRQWEPDIV